MRLPLAIAPGSVLRRSGAWLAIGVAAAALRLFTWSDGYTPRGVHLSVDDDSRYHVLRAERMVEGAPGAPWRDGSMNFPVGAEIPWPPLFDGALIASGWIAAGFSPPDRIDIERGGSLLPVFLGLLTIPAVALLARLLTKDGGWLAALTFALLPAHAFCSMLGRTDQHALEALLFTWLLVPVAWAVRHPDRGRRWTAPILGFLLALSFWNWIGSALYPLLLTAWTAGWSIAAPMEDRVSRRLAAELAWGAGLGAALLAATVALARGPSQLGLLQLSGLSGLQPLMLAMSAAFGALLLAALGRPAISATLPRRLGAVAACALLPAVAAFVLPGAWTQVARGLLALGRGGAWYASIIEFEPLIGGGWSSLREDLLRSLALFGLTPIVAPVAAALLARRLRGPGERAPVAFLLFLSFTLVTLTFARQRFSLYAAPFIALLVAHALGRGASALTARLGAEPAARVAAVAAMGAAVLGPALWYFGPLMAGSPPLAGSMERVLARVSALPVVPGRPAILAEWSQGHVIQYVTGRPVIASPFGVEGGDGALEDTAAFFLAAQEGSLRAVLERRGVGLIALGDPTNEILFATEFTAPAQTFASARRSVLDGATITLGQGVRGLVAWRLFFGDGASGLGTFRLLDESRFEQDGSVSFKMFGVVPGAILSIEGALPGLAAVVSASVRSPMGRDFEWSTSGVTDSSGRVALRVPYATGRNGRSVAGRYEVRLGSETVSIAVSEVDVLLGRAVAVPRAQSRTR
jgi:asparagine N-glycosylation enzyme membrane subunit Stt3